MASDISYSRVPAEAAERWQTVRDVCYGAQALKKKGYLDEVNPLDKSLANVERNRSYVKRAVLYNVTSFTRNGLLGLAFRFDPRTELPEKLKYLTTDCDGANTSIYQQSQDVLGNIIEVGRHGLFVDFSAALNRPIIKAYCAEAIINWRETQVDGKTVLTLVVLKEEVEEDDGYGITAVKQWRELLMRDGKCVCRVWRDGEKPTDPKVAQVLATTEDGMSVTEIELRSSGKVLDFIPFYFIGSESNRSRIDPAPLYDLADLNIAHFQNSAEYEDSVFIVGQVQPWISGLDENWRDHLENPRDAEGRPTGKTLYIGSRAPMLLPSGGAFGFAQAQPNMLAKEAMQHKEAQMVALGARIIEAKLANKTATGEDNDREASTSVLALCCSNVTEAYQAAIRACGRYLDMPTDGAEFESTYKINQQFVKASANPQVVAQLVTLWQTGAIAKTDLRAYIKLQGLLATERTDEAIDGDIKLEGPTPGTMVDPLDVPDDDEAVPPNDKAPAGAA